MKLNNVFPVEFLNQKHGDYRQGGTTMETFINKFVDNEPIRGINYSKLYSSIWTDDNIYILRLENDVYVIDKIQRNP